MLTPLSAPLLFQSFTLNLSNSYSPPYTSRIEPSTPPSSERILDGLRTVMFAVVILSVENENGQSTADADFILINAF